MSYLNIEKTDIIGLGIVNGEPCARLAINRQGQKVSALPGGKAKFQRLAVNEHTDEIELPDEPFYA